MRIGRWARRVKANRSLKEEELGIGVVGLPSWWIVRMASPGVGGPVLSGRGVGDVLPTRVEYWVAGEAIVDFMLELSCSLMYLGLEAGLEKEIDVEEITR